MKLEFKIGIIDDSLEKIATIKTLLLAKPFSAKKQGKYSNIKFNVFELDPQKSMNEVIGDIYYEKLDCMLIDYKLDSFSISEYNGVDLDTKIEETLYNFPMFILTSHEDELFNKEVCNVYQVLDFELYTNEEFERDEVHGKIIEQIQMFKKQKKEWEKELKNLMPQAGISEKIDSKIIELDSKIEKSIDGRSALSDELKRELKSDKLMSLMEKIEQILNEE